VAIKIKAEPDADGIRFMILLPGKDGLEADVYLRKVTQQMANPSLFGMTNLPAHAVTYEVETNNPKVKAHVLHIDSQGKIVVRTANGEVKEYSGQLKDLILQAYNDGAFR